MRRLRIVNGPASGASVLVDRDIVVGREAADLMVPDERVSRRHAVVRPSVDGVEIEDLGSANGTFVDGVRIEGTRAITGEARIRIGETELELEAAQVDEPSEAEPAEPPRRGRRRLVGALVVVALAAAAAVAAVVLVERGNGGTTYTFDAAITTLPLASPTSVVVSGVLKGQPVGRVMVIIQRTLKHNPTPGGAAVPFDGQMLVIAPKGAMGFDVKGALQLTSDGGEIVRGTGVASRGGGEFKDFKGSFTLTGGRPRSQTKLARFAINGTLTY